MPTGEPPQKINGNAPLYLPQLKGGVEKVHQIQSYYICISEPKIFVL